MIIPGGFLRREQSSSTGGKFNRWQAQQVGAEALPGLAGGLVAALFVELPLILLRLFVMTAALVLKFEVSQQTHDSLP